MIDVSTYTKVGEYSNGSLKWLSRTKENAVYLICFGNDTYVGSTQNLHRRFSQYIPALKNGSYEANKMQEAFNKNKNFSIFVIEYTDSVNLRKKEGEYIERLKPSLNSKPQYDTSNRPNKLRIKELLDQRGIKSKALSSMIGITEMGMSNIVTGKSIPNGKTIMDIAKALGVTCGELFDDYAGVQANCPHCGKPIKIELKP